MIPPTKPAAKAAPGVVSVKTAGPVPVAAMKPQAPAPAKQKKAPAALPKLPTFFVLTLRGGQHAVFSIADPKRAEEARRDLDQAISGKLGPASAIGQAPALTASPRGVRFDDGAVSLAEVIAHHRYPTWLLTASGDVKPGGVAPDSFKALYRLNEFLAEAETPDDEPAARGRQI